MTAGPVVLAVLEGPEAITVVRSLVGATNGRKAAPGTIRGDFGLDQQYNLVHASDGPESARSEIALFFRPEEVVRYERAADRWVVSG
jgi:nucleoside-diphosphate kinase